MTREPRRVSLSMIHTYEALPKLGVAQVSCHQVILGQNFSMSSVVEGLLRNGVELGVRDVVVPWELEVFQ